MVGQVGVGLAEIACPRRPEAQKAFCDVSGRESARKMCHRPGRVALFVEPTHHRTTPVVETMFLQGSSGGLHVEWIRIFRVHDC